MFVFQLSSLLLEVVGVTWRSPPRKGPCRRGPKQLGRSSQPSGNNSLSSSRCAALFSLSRAGCERTAKLASIHLVTARSSVCLSARSASTARVNARVSGRGLNLTKLFVSRDFHLSDAAARIMRAYFSSVLLVFASFLSLSLDTPGGASKLQMRARRRMQPLIKLYLAHIFKGDI